MRSKLSFRWLIIPPNESGFANASRGVRWKSAPLTKVSVFWTQSVRPASWRRFEGNGVDSRTSNSNIAAGDKSASHFNGFWYVRRQIARRAQAGSELAFYEAAGNLRPEESGNNRIRLDRSPDPGDLDKLMSVDPRTSALFRERYRVHSEPASRCIFHSRKGLVYQYRQLPRTWRSTGRRPFRVSGWRAFRSSVVALQQADRQNRVRLRTAVGPVSQRLKHRDG